MNSSIIYGAAIFAATSAFGQTGATPTNDTFTAATLYSACVPQPGEAAKVRELAEQTCIAYLRGLTDGLYLDRAMGEVSNSCSMSSDTPVNNEDARRIFVVWVKNHPESAKHSAGVVAAAAIRVAYGCMKRN